ncbi:hypothetical protein CI610_01968 [invertebrate metagenome]|uniref:DUF2059 domain-containing protein n=1 Tax=invertebrate metagenome TaxID=1711999 RepID=A0A2H9T754_9ZZZZ
MIRKNLVVLLFVVFSSWQCSKTPEDTATRLQQNQEREKEQLQQAAIEFLDASNAASILDSVHLRVDNTILKYMESIDQKDDTTKAIMEQYTQKMIRMTREEISFDKLSAALTTIYMDTYTINEMKDITRFYQTDTGQKMLANMPTLTKKNMKVIETMVKGLTPKLQEAMNALKADLQKTQQRSTTQQLPPVTKKTSSAINAD